MPLRGSRHRAAPASRWIARGGNAHRERVPGTRSVRLPRSSTCRRSLGDAQRDARAAAEEHALLDRRRPARPQRARVPARSLDVLGPHADDAMRRGRRHDGRNAGADGRFMRPMNLGDEAVARAVVQVRRRCPSASILPAFITTIRSAISIASCWSCVTMIVVIDSALCRSLISPRRSSRTLASSADSGSSSSSTTGFGASARASATRCCCPPGELVRVLVRLVGEVHQVEHLAHAARNRLLRPLPAFESVGDVARHRHVGKQRVRLEHDAEVARARRDVAEASRRQRDLALVGLSRAPRSRAAASSCRSPTARGSRRTRLRRYRG